MIDVVIPLGIGSNWSDNEIRYCLRSIEQNLLDLRDIYIVGHKPHWMQKVIHVCCEDTFRHNKDANLIKKVLEVCRLDKLSLNFVRMSDDQLILKPIVSSDIKNYYHQELKDFNYSRLNNWGHRLQNTYLELKKQSKPTKNYDCHIPSIYNKYHFRKIMGNYNWREDLAGYGYVINSLYFNNVCCNPVLIGSQRANIEQPKPKDELKIMFDSCIYFNYNEVSLNNDLKDLLEETFPNKSKFEI